MKQSCGNNWLALGIDEVWVPVPSKHIRKKATANTRTHTQRALLLDRHGSRSVTTLVWPCIFVNSWNIFTDCISTTALKDTEKCRLHHMFPKFSRLDIQPTTDKSNPYSLTVLRIRKVVGTKAQRCGTRRALKALTLPFLALILSRLTTLASAKSSANPTVPELWAGCGFDLPGSASLSLSHFTRNNRNIQWNAMNK